MRRAVIAMLVLALIGAVLSVANSGGFPSTHWAVHGFFHDTLGLSDEDAGRAAGITRKCFHIPAYALLALLTWFVLPEVRRKGALVLGIVLVIAIADETLQSFQPGRTGRAWDVLVDLFGALLGIALARWWGRRRARTQASSDGA